MDAFPIPEMTAAKDKDGNLVLNAALTPEQVEHLRVMYHSAGWKIYRQMLITMKDGHQLHMLPKSDPNEILKELGIVVGLNSSINQLGVLMAQLKKQQDEHVARESKNLPQP